MKAHGIEKSNGGGASSAGASGGSGPATPKTPATGGKTANRTTPASKKRKMAARGDDIEEDEVKLDIKEEIKLESANAPDGSYIICPNKPPSEASAAGTLVSTPDGAEDGGKNNDDLLLLSESRREDGTAPVALTHQALMPPPTDSFYNFIDPATTLQSPPQNPVAACDILIPHECDHADYAQAMATLRPDGRHWLYHHDPVFYWSDVHLEPHSDIKHD